MKKTLLLTLFGFLVFIGFLVTNVPAAVIVQLADERNMLPDNIEISGIEGTLWEGSAQRMTIDNFQLPKTSWSLSGDSLFEQKLLVDIQSGHSRSDLFAKGLLIWDGEQLGISDARVRASREKIQEWITLPYPIAIDGRLSITIPTMTLQQGQCIVLDGKGALSQAEVQTPFGEVDLGQVDFDLDCKSNRLNIVAYQNSAELKTSAKVTVDINGRYTLSGSLLPQSELAEPFKKSLSFLGRANANGEYPLKARGSL